jgi:phosphohistidine phosphatase
MDKTKTSLLIMRHAKSDPVSTVVEDLGRPLNKIGQKQPEQIANKLCKLKIKIEKAVVSSAKRASETFNLLSLHLDEIPELFFEPRLYQAQKNDFIHILIEHVDDCNSLLVIAHNPAVTLATQYLTGNLLEFRPANLVILHPRVHDLHISLKKPHQFIFEKMLVSKD